jgi:hypothetical protein
MRGAVAMSWLCAAARSYAGYRATGSSEMALEQSRSGLRCW